MKNLLLVISMLCMSIASRAAFAPTESAKSSAASQKTISLENFEAITGKKLNWLQRVQFKLLQHKLKRGEYVSAWDAEELTEGFQWLPFFGSLLTFGTVYLIMLFTAKDNNALRWARWGAFTAWVAWLAVYVVYYASGGGTN